MASTSPWFNKSRSQNARQALPTSAPPPAPVAPQPLVETKADYIDELKRLAELKEAGIISDEEFEAKKKQLLGL